MDWESKVGGEGEAEAKSLGEGDWREDDVSGEEAMTGSREMKAVLGEDVDRGSYEERADAGDERRVFNCSVSREFVTLSFEAEECCWALFVASGGNKEIHTGC